MTCACHRMFASCVQVDVTPVLIALLQLSSHAVAAVISGAASMLRQQWFPWAHWDVGSDRVWDCQFGERLPATCISAEAVCFNAGNRSRHPLHSIAPVVDFACINIAQGDTWG